MEQLSIRDWMILIGGIMIAAVLIDAVRRYWRERRAEIKLNTRIERASPLSGDDDAFNLLTELPNGGARIVHRDDLQVDPQATAPISEASASAARRDEADSTSRHEPAPDPIDVAVADQLAETSDSGSTEGASASTESASDDPALSEHDAVESAVGAVTSKPADDVPAPLVNAETLEEAASVERTVARATAAESPAKEQAESASRRRTVKPAPEAVEELPTDDVDTAGTVDWLDTLEPDKPLEPDAPEHGRLPRGANTHVFILYVVAQAEEGFPGTDILETLLACDLRFGDMDFFHRHECASGRGPIEFSVANMMKPGIFDIDNMEPLQTRGLMFFVTLPGPADMLKAFDYMYETVKVVAKSLGGDIQDETRSLITRQSLEHMRQQIRELERRLLVRRN